MKMTILKYGNLMGSPDLKAKMSALGDDDKAIDKLWDDCFEIKMALGLDGRSTSALLTDESRPDIFPAVVDLSYVCADPSTYMTADYAAIAAIAAAGIDAEDVKSFLITHPHGDHLDPRVLHLLPNARLLAHPDSKISGASALPEGIPGLIALNTPGHGTPHCSFIADLDDMDASVLIAGDLIMSHAHYLSLDEPIAFSDPAAGRRSVAAALDALNARPTTYRLILPGHDIPFFI